MANNNYIVLLLFLLTGCGSGGDSSSPTATESRLPIYIASGQSNMAKKMNGDIASPGEMPAIPEFIYDIAKMNGRPLSVIPTAIGATSLDCWQVGGACFEQNIRPLQNLPIKGVFWWQGEWDAEVCDSSADTYGDRFAQMIADWRAFFSTPDLPFYVVQLGTVPSGAAIDPAVFCGGDFSAWANKWEAVKAGQMAAAALTNVHVIATSDITFGDTIHPIYAYSEIARRISDLL